MKAVLILAGPYSSCNATEIIWTKLCNDRQIGLEIFNLTNTDGQNIATTLNIKSFPAFIIDNKVIAVGHPSEQTAAKAIKILDP